MDKDSVSIPQELETAKKKKRALGRGLDALIPDIGDFEDKTAEYFQCSIDLIRPNRYQPRRNFPEEELAELCQSIREQGIIQPLIVRKDHQGYELVAGERRLRAAKMAGLNQVPVVVKNVSEARLLELSIIENIQREDLNPLETAEAYQRLIAEFNLTQEQVSDRVGKSRSAVANFLRLRQLPEPIKDSIVNRTLSMGHARAILGAETAAHQLAAWRTVISKGLSVRETEALIKRLKTASPEPEEPQKTSEEIYLESLGEELTRHFGTKVRINRKGKKGRVEIEFFSNEDLDRLISLLINIRNF